MRARAGKAAYITYIATTKHANDTRMNRRFRTTGLAFIVSRKLSRALQGRQFKTAQQQPFVKNQISKHGSEFLGLILLHGVLALPCLLRAVCCPLVLSFDKAFI